LLLGGCAATRPASLSTLPVAVTQALQCAQLPAESLGLLVLPLKPDAPGLGLAHQPDRAMQPASTMKLVTSVVALDRLGPNHRGHTELLTAAVQQGDQLQGDVVLRGGADPELGLAAARQLFAELRWQGVAEIAGDIVLDRSLFRPARMDLGLPPFDEAPEFPYNVVPDALQLAGNLVTLELQADALQVRAQLLPPLTGVEIDNQLELNDRECRAWDADWRTPIAETLADGRVRLRLHGAFPRGCRQRPALQLFDRDQQAERQLRMLWEGLGGRWSGHLRMGAAPPDARRIARHDARPWGELMRPMNKQSDNVLARLLFLSLGLADSAAEPAATTQALADRTVRRWFAEQRIDSAGMVLDNGSGLSRSERLSARQMAELLRVALNGPFAPELMMSLPIAGVDGTMRNRLKDSPAAGRARLKTGYLRNVNSVAGYVPDGDGRVWVLAAMVNADGAAQGRPVLDALVDWVADGGLTGQARSRVPTACAAPR
jgi:D-alanyl-D-alanine carboxypeptidase/D-alanyl-D-alanine-endopeptidase (penicillin-binding protein 4)